MGAEVRVRGTAGELMYGSSGLCGPSPSPLSDLQVMPYNLQQMGQQIFHSSYNPLLSYIPFIQPNYQYPQGTPPKLSTNPRDPSLMASDGLQYLIPQAYG